jgi:hypothetical protein
MSKEIEGQSDLIEDISEDQLEDMVEEVEVDEDLVEASTKKEAEEKPSAKVEVDDEDGEVEDEDDEDEEEDEEEASESKSKKMAKESTELEEAAKPKTKAGMIKAMYDKMSEMKKDDLMAAYEKVMQNNVAESVEEVSSEEAEKTFKEDLDALVEGEESLAEDFRGKAAVIFEAAVASKVSEISEELELKKEVELAEQVESVRSELVENVNGYLNYVVEQWVEKNEVAVTNGLRTEIAENFIDSLKALFIESYIEVPDSKVDMVDELSSKVEELEEELNKSVADNIDLAEKVSEYRREEILREATIGMAETEVEKLRSLAEGIEYESKDSFAKKIDTIKESYFKAKAPNAIEEQTNETQVSVSPMMDAYLKALSKK